MSRAARLVAARRTRQGRPFDRRPAAQVGHHVRGGEEAVDPGVGHIELFLGQPGHLACPVAKRLDPDVAGANVLDMPVNAAYHVPGGAVDPLEQGLKPAARRKKGNKPSEYLSRVADRSRRQDEKRVFPQATFDVLARQHKRVHERRAHEPARGPVKRLCARGCFGDVVLHVALEPVHDFGQPLQPERTDGEADERGIERRQLARGVIHFAVHFQAQIRKPEQVVAVRSLRGRSRA